MRYELDPIPDAARLGNTYRAWECDIHGIVTTDDVEVMDDGTAIHVGDVNCGGPVQQVDILIRDPRQWAQEGAVQMDCLAQDNLRLRRALADIAETQGPPQQLRRMARLALLWPRGMVEGRRP